MEGQPGKTEMAALDIMFTVKELRENLVGGMFRKIYQYGNRSREFLFEVFVPGKGSFWLYTGEGRIYITKFKKESPQEPPMFCMFLRKHLMGKKIQEVKQQEFDRIVEIRTEESVLIVELFGTGNLILCDSMNNIIMPLEVQRWKDREIRPKIPYKHPPRMSNPFEMDFDSFRKELSYTDKSLASYIASNLGFGAEYANEICLRAGVGPKTLTKDIKYDQATRVQNAMASLASTQPRPVVYEDYASPFPLEIFQGKEFREAGGVSAAFDEFFSRQIVEDAKGEVTQGASDDVGKAERIVKQQQAALEKWKRLEKEAKETGDLIYKNYPIVQDTLNGIKKARQTGMSWSQIRELIGSEDSVAAQAIKEIKEGDGVIVLELEGIQVEIDLRKTVEENAAGYYEDSKWARKKHGGIEDIKEGFEQKLETAKEEHGKVAEQDFAKKVFPTEKKSGEQPEESETEKPKAKRKKWYEKYKWFLSSDGLIVVAGRDAASNEMLLKKNAQDGDVVFHADIQGAAFVVIKADGKEVPDLTKKEAAEFAAANCKAWSKGLANVDIFSVTKENVTKTSPSGVNLPRGSFFVNGERTWYKDLELKLAVGIKLHKEEQSASVVYGPIMPTRKNSDYFVTVKPGYKKSLELVMAIKNKILIKARPEDKYLIEKVPMEDIQSIIPSGTGDVVELG